MADPACPLPATPPFSVEPLIALDVEKVPFVVGVTGHRDLNPGDLVSLQAAVEKLLREIKDRHESATIVLLSPLAEGADRIAAKAAYALGIPVVVPMPMPQDEYEHDFPKSVKEFRDLVHGAYHSFELPLVEGNTRANIGYKAHGYKPHRDRQYQALGQYIARHCQELIALWDGIPADGGGGSEAAAIVQYERDGVEQAELIAIWDKIPADDDGGAGTAAVVKYKLEGIERRLHFECDLVLRPASSESSLLDSSECGPVHHIWTRRRGCELREGQLSERRDRFPESGSRARAEKYYEDIFALIGRFNKESKPLDYEKKHERLSPKLRNQVAPHEVDIWERLAVADAIAIDYHRKLHKNRVWVHGWVFVGSLFFAALAHLSKIFASLFTHPEFLYRFRIVLLVLTVAAWGKAFWVYRRTKRFDLQDKYQDYRALAEGLRVQFFWYVAGIQESIANYYFGKQRVGLDWIRNAIRNWRTVERRTAHPERENLLAPVLELWVMEQRHYFKSRPDGHERERFEKWVHVFLWAAGGVGVVLFRVLLLAPFPHGMIAFWTPIIFALVGAGAWYFKLRFDRRSRRQHIEEKRKWNHRLLGLAAGIGVGLLALVTVNIWLPHISDPHDPHETVIGILICCIEIFLVSAGVVHHYKEQMAFSEHEKQYDRVALTFSRAADLIEEALRKQNFDKARLLLRDLGIAALEEHGDWVVVHRQRPFEVPPLG